MAVHVTDITERKRHEDQVRLLMHEVNHRSKNMLTLVQAIARQTLAATHEDFLERFGARVHALAASQDLLVKNAWTGADIEDLVRSQLAHFEDLIGRRIELQGPQLFVSAHAAQTIGMALHELATNAGKYGALASEDGHVAISWGMQHGESGEAFIMTWRERCAHPIAAPSKRGFGSTVICEMTGRSLGATVDLDFPVTGLTWRLKCSAGEVLDRTGSTASGGDDGPAHSAA
jgi:two-component sensor histidine kinase